MRTGDLNPTTAVYRSLCCHIEVTVAKGAALPLCTACGQPGDWQMVRAYAAKKCGQRAKTIAREQS